MERNYQDKQHKGQRMKALTFEKELDDFLERLLRQESVGRRRNRFPLYSLWQVDRRNKRRKSFGNLLLTKSLIWAESFRVWESFERLSCTTESISARHCPPPSWDLGGKLFLLSWAWDTITSEGFVGSIGRAEWVGSEPRIFLFTLRH